MAEFRKLFYAFGVAALFTGLSSTASAQVQCNSTAGVPPIIRAEGFTELVGDYVMDCVGGVKTAIGLPVPSVNITVTMNAPITSRLLGTAINPSFGTGSFTEALLIIDEPNSATNSARPLLACGATNAPDTSASGLGVCSIIAPADSTQTYNGATNTAGSTTTANLTVVDAACDGIDPDGVVVNNVVQPNTGGPLPARPGSATAYGCGRPNVFQGRQLAGQPNVIVFNGVPFNPPGAADSSTSPEPHRTLRFTNFRVAPQNFAAGSLVLQSIIMSVNINASMTIAITNRDITVASVLPGITLVGRSGAPPNFVQCVGEFPPSPGQTAPNVSVAAQYIGNARPVVFREGFASSFKTKGLEQITGINGTNGNGLFDGQYWRLRQFINNSPASVSNPAYIATGDTSGVRQNVPGAVYNTESGFTAHPQQVLYAGPGGNPPSPFGSVNGLTGDVVGISNRTGISSVGIATQGTRIAIRFADLPRGITMVIPSVVFLYRAGEGPNPLGGTTSAVVGSPTGVAVRTFANARGDGGFNNLALAAGGAGLTNTSTATSNQLVYEVLFDDPLALEDFYYPVTISYTPQLASNLPDVTTSTVPTASGGFAPFIDLSQDSSAVWAAANFASATVSYNNTTTFPNQLTTLLPIPRFKPLGTDKLELFRIGKCACNLLFPFVTNFNTGRGNYDTGVAIANTSALPGTPIPPDTLTGTPAPFFNATGYRQFTAQQGPVQLWYYPADPADASKYPTQCTNSAVNGPCPGTKDVPAGGTLTFSVAAGNAAWGIAPRAGFTGYMVAQTAFQYCHAFAYISAQGAAPADPGMSVGYVALQLDTANGELPARTNQLGEHLNQ